jgi:hypothetical protein
MNRQSPPPQRAERSACRLAQDQQKMSHKNDSPQPWSFRIASRYYRSEAKVFGFCVALGCLLALIATSILDLSDANRWRSVFVTGPVLFSFGFAAIAIEKWLRKSEQVR